jgi:hypothetical protein
VNIEYGYSSNYCWWNSSSSSNLIENRVIEKEPDYYWSISTASGERPSAVAARAVVLVYLLTYVFRVFCNYS